MGSSPPDRLTSAAFLLVVTIAGCNFVAVKISNEGLAPFWGAFLRFSAAAVILGWIAVVRRLPLPRGRALVGVALYGILGFAVAYSLAYWSLVEVNANVVAVFTATIPLVAILLAALHGLEPLSRRGLLGAGIALAGMAVILAPGLSAAPIGARLVAAMLLPFAIAESTVLAKMFPATHPVVTNALGMGIGSVLLLAASLASGETRVAPDGPRVASAYLYLVLIGSVSMFSLFLFVLRRWTVSAVSYQAVLSPIVASLAAAWLVSEPVTSSLAVGGAIVLLGVYVGTLRPRPASTGGTRLASSHP